MDDVQSKATALKHRQFVTGCTAAEFAAMACPVCGGPLVLSVAVQSIDRP